MFNYIKADLYRLAHKKSGYVYYAILGILFTLFIMIAASNAPATRTVYFQAGGTLMTMVPLFVGIQIYLAVFTNDLSGRVLPGIFSTGISKASFFLAKFVTMLIYSFFSVAFLGLVYIGVSFAINSQLTGAQMMYIAEYASFIYLQIFAFFAVSLPIAYLTQSSVGGLVTYIVLSSGLIGQLLMLASHFFEPVKPLYEYCVDTLANNGNTIYSIAILTFNTTKHATMTQVIGLVCYVVIGFILGLVVLNRREIKEGE